MSNIPLLSGVVANDRADFLTSLPVNLEPVATENGIAKGFLRSAMGARSFATGPGHDRGGIVWNGVLYRVMGSKLVSISEAGVVTTLGDVGDDGEPAVLDYGFGRLAVASAGNLYYWDGASLAKVIDADLGNVVHMVWISGYYACTDATNIVVTQLNDPMSVNPLKYGSAEEDPDPIFALRKLRGELYALGGETIQVYTQIGGSGFPFEANAGATIPMGCAGSYAHTAFLQSFAFTGGARNEALGVYVAGNGSAQKISSRVIDDALAGEQNTAGITMETRVGRDEQRLYVHLTNRSYVYLASASAKLGEPIWYEAASGRDMSGAYRLRNAVFAYGKWVCGDAATAQIGALDEGAADHFGDATGWRFDTTLIYNQAKGGILHTAELVCLSGRGPSAAPGVAFLSTTNDGEVYSPERAISLGAQGQRSVRAQWRPHRRFRRYMGLRVRGDGAAVAGISALEAEIEGLAV